MTLTAAWKEVKGSIEETAERRAVAALAASVALPSLDTESASHLAETEGLVTHLTSLVLVDEAGAVQDGIPAARKVALPAPRLIAMSLMAPTQIAEQRASSRASHDRMMDAVHVRRNLDYNASTPIDPAVARVDLSSLGAEIDWDLAPHLLQAGEFSTLDRDVARAIQTAAALTEVVAHARQLALDPVALVIGLIARFRIIEKPIGGTARESDLR